MTLLNESLVLEAMKRSLDRGNKSWGYIKAILKSWLNKGYQITKDINKEILDYQKKNKQSRNYRQMSSSEVISDWFRDRDKKKENAKDGDSEDLVIQAELEN